jgi:hypothetical protein
MPTSVRQAEFDAAIDALAMMLDSAGTLTDYNKMPPGPAGLVISPGEWLAEIARDGKWPVACKVATFAAKSQQSTPEANQEVRWIARCSYIGG